jgi:hypothetical protein
LIVSKILIPLEVAILLLELITMPRLILVTSLALALASWQAFVSATTLELSEHTEQVVLSTSNVSVSFDVSAGARLAMPLNRQLISMSIE